MKSLLCAMVAMALVGCGAAPRVSTPAASSAGRVTGARVEAAERAIRAVIEKRVHDYRISLQALVVLAPEIGAVYSFQAEQTVSGLGGAKRFRLAGNYDAVQDLVTVSKRETLE